MKAAKNVLELIGNTPLVKVNHLDTGKCELFLKLENQNPGGSIKDRIALSMIEAAIKPNTRMIWIETPTNPLLKLVDLEAISTFAKKHSLISVVDNTFATPWIQRPIEYGFDVVMHSATKYLNGHSDIIGGIAVVGSNT